MLNKTPEECFGEVVDFAKGIIGDPHPDFKKYSVKIIWDYPGYKPQTIINHEAKEITIALHDYRDSYTGVNCVLFYDELSHEACHAMNLCNTPKEALRLEEAAAVWLSIRFLQDRMFLYNEDAMVKQRMGYELHGDSFSSLHPYLEKDRSAIIRIREHAQKISEATIEQLQNFAEADQKFLLERAYPA